MATTINLACHIWINHDAVTPPPFQRVGGPDGAVNAAGLAHAGPGSQGGPQDCQALHPQGDHHLPPGPTTLSVSLTSTCAYMSTCTLNSRTLLAIIMYQSQVTFFQALTETVLA